jgi:hypothetical protein
MRENCTSGSARGVPGNRHSYRRGCKHFMREKPEAFTPKRTDNLERVAIQGSDHKKDIL